MKLYVGNLPYSTTENELEKIFSEFGMVLSSKIIFDKYSGRSRGFGFVEMENMEDANKAISELHGKEMNERTLVVNEAREKERNNRPKKSHKGQW